MGMGSLRGERSGLTDAMEKDSTGWEEACQVLCIAKQTQTRHGIHHRVVGGTESEELVRAIQLELRGLVCRRRSTPDISGLTVVYTPGAWHGNNGTCTALGA